MIIYLYNVASHNIERHILELYDPMPYTTHSSLSVQTFRADSASYILWTTSTAMFFWNELCNNLSSVPTPIHAFRRICEGGHPPQSQHYTGTAFDFRSGGILHHISLPPCSYGYPITYLGDIGVHVFVLQDALYTLGISPCAIDGFFGPLTKAALCKFQRDYSLPVTGYADHQTWCKLTFHASGIGNINKIPHLS